MESRFGMIVALVLGIVAGGMGVYLLQERNVSEQSWQWVEGVPADLGRVQVTKAGWRRLGGGDSNRDQTATWGWTVRFANPRETDWHQGVSAGVALYDSQGLVLARSPEERTYVSVPAGGTKTLSRQATGRPGLLNQVDVAVVKLRFSDDCPSMVSYDSLVALVGRDEARARKQEAGRNSLNALLNAYCYGQRTDSLTLRATR